MTQTGYPGPDAPPVEPYDPDAAPLDRPPQPDPDVEPDDE